MVHSRDGRWPICGNRSCPHHDQLPVPVGADGVWRSDAPPRHGSYADTCPRSPNAQTFEVQAPGKQFVGRRDGCLRAALLVARLDGARRRGPFTGNAPGPTLRESVRYRDPKLVERRTRSLRPAATVSWTGPQRTPSLSPSSRSGRPRSRRNRRCDRRGSGPRPSRPRTCRGRAGRRPGRRRRPGCRRNTGVTVAIATSENADRLVFAPLPAESRPWGYVFPTRPFPGARQLIPALGAGRRYPKVFRNGQRLLAVGKTLHAPPARPSRAPYGTPHAAGPERDGRRRENPAEESGASLFTKFKPCHVQYEGGPKGSGKTGCGAVRGTVVTHRRHSTASRGRSGGRL